MGGRRTSGSSPEIYLYKVLNKLNKLLDGILPSIIAKSASLKNVLFCNISKGESTFLSFQESLSTALHQIFNLELDRSSSSSIYCSKSSAFLNSSSLLSLYSGQMYKWIRFFGEITDGLAVS